jgi:hypothetical protein
MKHELSVLEDYADELNDFTFAFKTGMGWPDV